MDAYMPDNYVQIDVKEIKDGFARCSMFTGQRDVQIIMKEEDYNELIREGFFIRDGKSKDNTGILNTTVSYMPERKAGGYQREPIMALALITMDPDPTFSPSGIDSAYPY